MAKRFYIWVCIVLVGISSLILGWSYLKVIPNDVPQQSTISKPDLYTRTDDQGAVRVSATWLNPSEVDATSLRFDILLDTHSINLDQYDLQRNTKLSINNQIVSTGINVEKKGTGHHIDYLLQVPVPDTPTPIRNIQLTIKDLANVPQRALIWHP